MLFFALSALTASSVEEWARTHGVKILGILIGALVIQFFIRRFTEKIVRRAIKGNRYSSPEAERKREDTIISIANGFLFIVLWVVAGMMVLTELGVQIAPLIATAGVAGLAFGFGGQYLIRDLISGFFIIAENQYRVGDVISINSTSGLVENITLRMTTLRDLDGIVHHIPNGNVTEVANMTKAFSRINLNIGVAYDTDLEQVIKVINDVGQQMAADKDWKSDITDPPKFLRVDDFADSAITIKILGETKPSRQWDVTGELRKRLKLAFDKNGIEIPFPQVVVHRAKE